MDPISPAITTQPLRILVIDDDPCTLKTLGGLLRLAKHEVIQASNGEAGIAHAREARPDLIVCDVTMPDMDGFSVLRALKHELTTATIPFIFLSGNIHQDDIRHGMSLGADDYLPKPFEPRQLFDSIQARIERQRAITEKLEAMRMSIAQSVPTELFTPLNAVLGFSMLQLDSLARGEELNRDDLRDSLESIHAAGEQLLRVASNYVLFAQLSAETPTAGPTGAVPAESWEPAVSRSIRKAARHHNRTKDIHYSFAPASLTVSAGHFEKIVLELLDNALKFSRSGEWIAVTGSIDNGHYVVRVADRGRGMARDQLETVAARLRYDRPHRAQPDLGLGLQICRMLAQRYKASVAIRANTDAGITAEFISRLAG